MIVGTRTERLTAAQYFELHMTYEVGPHSLMKSLQQQSSLAQPSLPEPPAIQIVDLRPAADFAKGHVVGAINLPFDPDDQNSDTLLHHLTKHMPVVVYSYGQYDTEPYQFAYQLARNHYNVRTLLGGWEGWLHYSLPIESDGAVLHKLGD